MITYIRSTIYAYRQDIFLFFASGVIAAIYAEKSRGRDSMTLATLSGRLNDVRFTAFLEKTHGKKAVEAARENPRGLAVQTQIFSDLGRKLILPIVFIASRYFAPTNPSLLEALKQIVSHSDKASRVALPILNRLAPVLTMPVIMSAPIIAKLAHITLLHFNFGPITMTDRFAKGLEITSNLAYTLHNVGTSTSPYHAIASASYLLAIQHLVSKYKLDSTFSMVLNGIPMWIRHQKYAETPDNSWHQYGINLAFHNNTFATTGVVDGLIALKASWEASSEPRDGERFFDLFYLIEQSSPVTTTGFEFLMGRIEASLESGIIGEDHAQALRTLLHKSLYERRAQEALKLGQQEMPARFKEIMDDLKKLGSELSPEQLVELKIAVKEQLKQYWQNLPRTQEAFTEHLNELFKYNGIFRLFATNNDDYFVPLEYHYHLFNNELERYLKNPEDESKLLALAEHVQIDRQTFAKTQAYSRALPAGTAVSETNISYAIATAPELAYRKIAPEIPANFKFKSKEFAEAIAKLRLEVGAPANTIPNLSLYS